MHELTSRAAKFFARQLATLAKFGAALLLAVTAVATPAALAGESRAVAQCSPSYEDAMRVLAEQRYAAAFACLAALADRGDPQAARMALALARYRPSLAGEGWSATPGQQRDWQALANDGEATGIVASTLDDGK